ncbi:LCP family protein [Nocardioides sp. Leaf307]|uniref:LCP family protein n=1 Tax=Nocardioides sp. Leaf307 TaxID=1736331 RepID=UPI000712B48B|nr:LCP family protein [Nocardioides sp. Leaf307]KQQ41714.1 hypothetical protein ASF50_12290 [Nocardioides sp. Leaf307]
MNHDTTPPAGSDPAAEAPSQTAPRRGRRRRPGRTRTGAAAAGGGHRTMARRHRRTVLRVVLTTQLCLALLTAAAVTLAYQRLDDNIAAGSAIPHVVEKEDVADDAPLEPLNILVMGSDNRDGEGNDIDGLTGGGQRADTTILVHVSADRQEAYGVSLPRDAIVDRPACRVDGEEIPGAEAAMFNTAFAVGGPLCTVQTVEQLTGIYVDHFVVLDFNGFKDMVDAVDGVEVCIPKDVDDPEHDIYFDAGVQELEGQQALNYVRERTVLSSTGDIGRMKRQQAFIASMVNKVFSAGTLTRVDRVYQFLKAATDSIEVDDQIDSLRDLTQLARQFRDTGLTKIRFISVPFEAYEPDPNRLVWTAEADALWKRIKADESLGREFRGGAISAADPVDGGGGSEQDAEEAAAAGLCA